MQIESKYFGKIEVKQEDLIHFPAGIPGFSDNKSFVLLDLADNELFRVLQATDTAEAAFIVASPYHFYQDYSFDLDDQTIELLNFKSEQDVVIYNIITLKEPFNSSTVNLQAPIVINQTKRIAKQYITNDQNLLTRAPIVSQKGAE